MGLAVLCLMGLAMVRLILAQHSPHNILKAHNVARAQVGVSPLTWDNRVAAFAQSHANRMVGTCHIAHSRGPYGENVAAGGGGDFPAAAAVKLWVDEKRFYNPNTNSCCGGDNLHYTQVIWCNSVRIGCASVKCNNGGTFITYNYNPPGNIVGQRPFSRVH